MRDSVSIYNEKIDLLKSNFIKSNNNFYAKKGRYIQLVEQRSEYEKELLKSKNKTEILEKVKILLQNVSLQAREKASEKIQDIVTNCLKLIFDQDLEFKIEISESRGRPEAEFYIISNYASSTIKTKPQDSRGGGVIDVISLALRIAMLESGSISVKGPIILDEPCKHLSEDYVINVADFLKNISKAFNRQIIMVTHNKYLGESADLVFRTELYNGITRINKENIDISK